MKSEHRYELIIYWSNDDPPDPCFVLHGYVRSFLQAR